MQRDRGMIRGLTAPGRLDDETYLSFVEGVRTLLVRQVDPAMRAVADAALADWQPSQPGPELDAAIARLDAIPLLRERRRLYRTTTEMYYTALAAAVHAREADLLAELDTADRRGPGSVEYDPALTVPDVYRREIHLMPGGYCDDPLGGYICHYGTSIFGSRVYEGDELRGEAVARIRPPADGAVRRILDIGSTVGNSTLALKRRWPDAEVWGIDAGIPMVRYAHKRAADAGIEVHFAQRLAEANGFPDSWFDLVNATIVFHEIPVANQEAVVAEARRVLRPGGVFVVDDFATELDGTRPLWELLAATDARDNCEPYAAAFVHSRFTDLLHRHFRTVEVVETPAGHNYPRAVRLCTA